MGDVDALCERIVIIDKGKMLYDNDILHLRRFFGVYRTLKIRPAENVADCAGALKNELVAFETSISSDDTWVSITVNEEKSRVMKVLEAVQNNHKIKDMQLLEISTEEVIKKIYEGGTNAKSA